MAESIPDVEVVKNEALRAFLEEFNEEAAYCVCAPGRVNIIGEHTDYNEGFVLPMALPMVTVIAGKANKTYNCKVISKNKLLENSVAEFGISIRKSMVPGEPKWSNYMRGVIQNFPVSVPGFNAVVISTVPMGAGLSSSAALEVATYLFLEALTDIEPKDEPQDKALTCQKAEHDFAGVPCGIMDQFISVMGEEGHALLLDCQNLSVTQIPIDGLKDHVFLITNSNSPHKLSSSAFHERRDACFEAAKMLGKKSLREATTDDLEVLKKKGASETILKRVKHVLSENSRTLAATAALQFGNYAGVGELMNQSHRSLRDNYEVSSPELDALVNAALKVPGVRGSRLTGAGFGGCTITFLNKDSVSEVIKNIQKTYSGTATFYIAIPSGGARQLDCNYDGINK